MALIEAVPNISEGRDESIIDAVVKSVEAGGSTILGVEPDVDYNRTVITYAGNKAEVTRSSVNLVETASKLIDMRNHHGNHPRMGAVDVMPFIALGESTDKDAERVAEDVYQILADDYSLFKYGLSASHPSRARLPSLRRESMKDSQVDSRAETGQMKIQDFLIIGMARQNLLVWNSVQWLSVRGLYWSHTTST